jgi:hypothetical protein
VEADPGNMEHEDLPPLNPDTLPPIDDDIGGDDEATTGEGRRPPVRRTEPPDENRTLDIVYVEVCADTGAVSTVYCPERVKKPFLDGSQPKQSCPQHRPPR